MDDLKLLRDLGRELEHEPPATLAAQRNRLSQAHPRRRLRGWMMISLAAVATALAVAVPNLILTGHQTVAPPIGARPAKVTGALNVLLVGSDSRDGAPQYGRPMGQRSDTMIIVHIPADRQAISAVNLPRDSMVTMPKCAGGGTDMINAALNRGGLSCAIETVEKNTDIRIDHAASMDFLGFKEIVDALGGVEVKVPKAIDDNKAKLHLAAGKQQLNGQQALGWMRLRSFGDGSDLARIKRQQALLRAMAAKAMKVVGEPDKLRDLVSTAKKWVTTTEGFDLETMYGLAAGLGSSKISFATVPVKGYPADRNRLAWKQPDAEKLFATFR